MINIYNTFIVNILCIVYVDLLYIKSSRVGPGPWAAPQARANQAETKPGPAWPLAPIFTSY